MPRRRDRPHTSSVSEVSQNENMFSELEMLGENIQVGVHSIEENGMTMEFDLISTTPPFANALRRVPSMAPETVNLQQNKSAMADEVLCHRLGLIPFRADPRKYKFRIQKEETPDFVLTFELKVVAPHQNLKTDKRFLSTKVHSKDFVWIPDPQWDALTEESSVRPVNDDILINVLRPSQEMDLRIHVAKGIGKDHIKFSPVSLASYRHLPDLTLLRSVGGDDADRLQKCFSKGVVEIDVVDGIRTARIANARADTGSRNILRDQYLKDAVRIDSVKDHFIFSVESVGALTVASLVKEACEILKGRCEYHFLSIGYQLNVKKM